MVTTPTLAPSRPTVGSRRVGYAFAAVINAALLAGAHRLPDWGWPPFLTPAFADLLPWITLSLGTSVAVNLLWAWHDPAWLRHLAQIGLNVLAMVAAVKTWEIFPFDFSAYTADWELLVRAAIALSLFGLAVATLVEAVELAVAAAGVGRR